MGKLKKFVEWSQRKFISKWIIASIFLIIGIAGLILPILQGWSMVLIALLILIPNKKLSERIFKHERIITYSLVIGFLILLIIPAIFYAYGILPNKYGEIALNLMQIGQKQIQTFFKIK